MHHSKSLKMAPFNRSYTTSYQSATVSVALSCTTLETRYNTLQYNANLVITRLQCWLPLGWELHPAKVSTAGRDVMRDQTYADHLQCVTRDGIKQQQCGLLCTCMSSIHLCRRGREE